jgi:hypothetical protein
METIEFTANGFRFLKVQRIENLDDEWRYFVHYLVSLSFHWKRLLYCSSWFIHNSRCCAMILITAAQPVYVAANNSLFPL